jgi:hypothetical protein
VAVSCPGQSFLPEEHWRAMEPEVREELVPIADTWVVEEHGELVAFMSLPGSLIGGCSPTPTIKARAMAEPSLATLGSDTTRYSLRCSKPTRKRPVSTAAAGLSITNAASTTSQDFRS